MDLFGDMLFQFFEQNHSQDLQVELLRPRMNNRFSRLPLASGSKHCANADRFLNRFLDYPSWLRKRRSQFDVFHIVDHSYAQLTCDLPADRVIVTCHDLDTFRCILDPKQTRRPLWFRMMTRKTLDGFLRARHIICPSGFTKAQLVRLGWFAEDRVTVIPPGVDPAFFAPHDPANASQVKRVTNGAVYLLHVGSTMARKRIDILLHTFAEAVKDFPNLRLVRVGGPFAEDQQILSESLGLVGKIIHLENVPKASLAALYQEAALLLQTSEAEGFGLPVIEAMACGCPVLASEIPALREAGAAAAEFCAVGDIGEWAEKVKILLHERDASPEKWTCRKDFARQHALRFTWAENAKQTLTIYRRALGSDRPT